MPKGSGERGHEHRPSYQAPDQARQRSGTKGHEGTLPQGLLVVLDHAAGQLRTAPAEKGTGQRVLGADLYPWLEAVLATVTEGDGRVGALVPGLTRPQASQGCEHAAASIGVGSAQPLTDDPHQGIKKLIGALDVNPADTMLLSGDRVVRAAALEAGMGSVAHPALAGLTLQDPPVRLARVEGPQTLLQDAGGLIPYAVTPGQGGSATAIVALGPTSRAELAGSKVAVHHLDVDPSIEDLIEIRLDADPGGALEHLAGGRILSIQSDRALVALGPDDRVSELGIHGAHGHNRLLAPEPRLFDRVATDGAGTRSAMLAIERLKGLQLEAEIVDWPRIPPLKPLGPLCPGASQIQATVDRYGGGVDPDGAGPIASRHVDHPDNARAVQLLVDNLSGMGYCPTTHAFSFEGRTLHNVVADLPGRGLLRLPPDVLDAIRGLLLDPLQLKDPGAWSQRVEEHLDAHWLGHHRFGQVDPTKRPAYLAHLMGLGPWVPWWLDCPLAGPGAGIVIVGCHLDSTAARDTTYDPSSDAAPGVDDDASGIAAVLAVAKALKEADVSLQHTVRFCFFNAEEQGLVGSQAYASLLKSHGAPVHAVICADMIGHNADPARIFEVHAGYTDSAVRDASVPIAETIADWANAIGALDQAQIYSGTNPGHGTDRTVYDGAIGRSDHASFHAQGYPAVVVSEDFFANLSSEPGSDANPDYHESDDTTIDAGFAADIACAVLRAVRELAQS